MKLTMKFLSGNISRMGDTPAAGFIAWCPAVLFTWLLIPLAQAAPAEKVSVQPVLHEAVLGQDHLPDEADIIPLPAQPAAGAELPVAVPKSGQPHSQSGVPADQLLVHPGLQTVAETYARDLNQNTPQPGAGLTGQDLSGSAAGVGTARQETKLFIMAATVDSGQQPAIESQAGLQPQSLAADQAAGRIQAAGDSHVFRLPTTGSDPAVYFMSEHGAAPSRWDLARLEQGITAPAILIHVDAHADLDAGEAAGAPAASAAEAVDKQYGIISFIAPAAVNRQVSEIYWVVPEFRRAEFGAASRDITYYAAEIVHLDGQGQELQDEKGRALTTAYFDQHYPDDANAAELATAPHTSWPVQAEGFRIDGIHPVTVHRVYADQLPDFSRSGQPVIFDIDEDYFWMNSVDGQNPLPREGKNGGTFENRLQQDVQTILQKANQRYIDPFVITVALSPGCTPPDLTGTLTTSLIQSLPTSGLIAADTATDNLDEYSQP